jgi:hypothetical protein
MRLSARGLCSGFVMTHTPHTALLLYVRIHWQRLQSCIASRYHRRVTQPLQFWLALGRPPFLRPRLPWWQPLVWRWLVITGWVEPRPRRRRS